MIPVAALIGALDGQRQEKRLQRANRIGKAVGFILFWAFGLTVTGMVGYFLWSTWQSTDTSAVDLVQATGFAALMAFFLEGAAIIVLLIPVRPAPRNQEIAAALRQLIVRGDEALTPTARLQPRTSPSSELSGHPVSLQPIRHTPNTAASAWAAILVVALLILPFTLFCNWLSLTSSTFIGGNGSPTFDDSITAIWLPLVYFCVFILLISTSMWTRLNRRRGAATKVVLDDQGVHYRRGRQDLVMAWGQIRSLVQITVNPLGSSVTPNTAVPTATGTTTYMIDGGSDLFIWSVAAQAKDEDLLAAETLLQQVAARTGLPLRDATDLATEITRYGATNAGRILLQRTRTEGSEDRSLAIVDALRPIAPAPKPSRRKIALVAIAVVLLAAANGLLPLAGLRLERAMSAYRANFVATMRAHGQLYVTDFAENDGNWPEARASKNDFRNYVFTGGSYHLSGTIADQFINAWLPVSLTDAAVEVTVSQKEQIPPVSHQDPTGGAGLMFHANPGNTSFVAFTVETDGHWWISQYRQVDEHASDNWNVLNEGFSPAIHTGQGARNTILCIQQGRHITIYVNGQQVDSEDFSADYYRDLPLDGYAGIYTDQSAMDTAFTRFAVYRLPSPPDFWATLESA